MSNGKDESLLTKIKKGINNLETLKIRTIVGELEYNDKEKDYVHKDGQKVEGITTEIHLATGDIDTRLTEKFVDEYEALREYHQVKEIKGQEIVRNNLNLIKEIFETISKLPKNDPDAENKPNK